MVSNHYMQSTEAYSLCLITIFIMRVCIATTSDAIRAVSISDYIRDNETGSCQFHGGSTGDVNFFVVPEYLIQFFLPALGGLLADKWHCEAYLLRISGILLLVAAVYVAAIEMAGYICIPWMYLLGLLPSSFANGIAVSPLLAAPLKISDGEYGSPTPGLIVYYVSGVLGQIVGYSSKLVRPYVNLTWIFCAFPPLVYIASSFVLNLDFSSYQYRFRHQITNGFQFPTKTRVLRYFLLLAPLILLVNVIGFAFKLSFCLEINYYLNTSSSTNATRYSCAEVFTGNLSAIIGTLGILALCYRIGYLGLKNGQISGRFYSGLTALLISRSALIAWNSWAASLGEELPDPWLVHTVYSAASIMDGIGNALALATGYELMYRVAQVGNKNLVMGFLLTVWATGVCLTGITVLIMKKLPRDHPILEPVHGKSNYLWILYVTMAAEVILIGIYYRFVSVKIFPPMMELAENFEETIDDETDELCESVENRNTAVSQGSGAQTAIRHNEATPLLSTVV